jgi:4-hydroxybutyrate CoA-transferase
VTEYGVADLRGKSLRERAKALIAISHPDFRADLQAQAEKRFL